MSKYSTRPMCLVLVSIFSSYTSIVTAEDLGLDDVEVLSTTPVKGVGLPLNKIPAGVQQADQKDFVQQKNITISDYMNQNMLGVNINETQGNPYQPDVNYHGFTASPLVGTPQGLSVYVDGVRVNEAFGDVVNWDLIPMNAISNMALIPGSNPLFGLNTLGGAISVQTKSGRTNQGAAVEAYTGSWGRRVINAEYGGVSEDGSKDFFISGNSFEEDGWRKFSSTRVQQLFSKVGWQDDRTSIHLSLSLADNKMVGNGTQAGSLFNTLGYNSIYTAPDITGNKMGFGNLTFSHYFSDDIQLSGNVYYRHVNTQSINGNINGDTYAGSASPGTPASVAIDNANCLGGDNTGCTGEDIMGMTHQDTYGFTSQLTFMQDLMGMQNQFVAGIGFNHGRVKYKQYNAYGVLSDQLYVNLVPGLVDPANVDLSGTTQTSSVFATDTLSLNDFWYVTASARYNTTRVNNSDHLLPSGPGSLTGHDVYNRLNPSIGVNFTPSKDLTTYAAYNESSRAPTTIELGCADPSNQCALPNALAGDPPLKQVVSKTYELGARGALTQNINWSLDVYHTMNYNDIQFISNQASVQNQTGFFSNVGTTRREGFDASLNGRVESFTWMVGYSYVDATYQTQLTLPNSNNTSANADGQIAVSPGSYIPAIPKHQLKLRLGYDVTPQWNLGSNIFAYSNQYSRGNENNQDTSSAAKVPGYTVVNLFTNYNFNNGWSVFARVNNVFDREYYTLGQLGTNVISTTTGQFTGNGINDGFYAPGAPRAGWIGARYEFGAHKSITGYDKD